MPKTLNDLAADLNIHKNHRDAFERLVRFHLTSTASHAAASPTPTTISDTIAALLDPKAPGAALWPTNSTRSLHLTHRDDPDDAAAHKDLRLNNAQTRRNLQVSIDEINDLPAQKRDLEELARLKGERDGIPMKSQRERGLKILRDGRMHRYQRKRFRSRTGRTEYSEREDRLESTIGMGLERYCRRMVEDAGGMDKLNPPADVDGYELLVAVIGKEAAEDYVRHCDHSLPRQR